MFAQLLKVLKNQLYDNQAYFGFKKIRLKRKHSIKRNERRKFLARRAAYFDKRSL